MKPEKLLDAAEVLTWLSNKLAELSEDKEAAVLALHCTAASLGCVELAKHKLNGEVEADAVAATARGEMEFSALKRIASKYLH